MTEQPRHEPIPVALVYWGRRGAGVTLTAQTAEALAQDPRFRLFVSTSVHSEAPLSGAELPIRTFSGPVSLIAGTLALPATINALVGRMAAAGVRAAVTVMPHIWGLAFQLAARRAGIRTILIVHDADPHPGERRPVFDWLVRREIRGSDRIVTLSGAVADRLIAQGAVDAPRLSRLFLPILGFQGPAPGGTRPARPFRLLFFGRILPYKGIPLLLEAFVLLRAAGVDCTLRIVGQGRIDAPGSLTDQPGLIIDQGWVAPDAVGAVLADADAIVAPYIEASQSGAIVAAYGVGLPAVATPVSGLAEQIVDGETGTLAAAATAPALAAAIRRLIETPGLYEACRAGAARYAEAHSQARFATAIGDTIMATIEAPPR